MELHRGRLIDHNHLRAADLEASKRFYRAALGRSAETKDFARVQLTSQWMSFGLMRRADRHLTFTWPFKLKIQKMCRRSIARLSQMAAETMVHRVSETTTLGTTPHLFWIPMETTLKLFTTALRSFPRNRLL